ncbi:MAG: hypothetical protein GTN69_01480 [Armatimonadetes bacterium]|nr:hypothetical protein [Armatimonadota bacterium]NIO74572.1 hypothetical protein [Armatimonadota bacterium]NIO97497.1 hypothetical protein [Armatimonadota bacterium]
MNPTIESVKQVSKERMRQLVMAMEFMPLEGLQWRANECVKSPLEIYLECVGGLLMAAQILRGETADWERLLSVGLPEVERFPTLEGAKAMMKRYQEEFFAALDSLDESRLGEIIDLPWGAKMSISEFILLPAKCACFHCGQISFYEALLGGGTVKAL